MSSRSEHVTNYKTILRSVIDTRPSGMSQRLSEALEKNRSFVSQISSPNYSIPVPYKHLDTIFRVCGFSSKQREAFLNEYYLAHPKYADSANKQTDTEQTERTITLPNTGNPEIDDKIEKLVVNLIDDIVSIYQRHK